MAVGVGTVSSGIGDPTRDLSVKPEVEILTDESDRSRGSRTIPNGGEAIGDVVEEGGTGEAADTARGKRSPELPWVGNDTEAERRLE